MFTALALKWYVASNTHNANWKSFNISQHFTYFSLLFPAPGSESSHIFWVYLGVKPVNFSLVSSYYFPWFYCVDFSVASLYSLFYVTREFHRFLHWGWVVLKTKHSKTKTEACRTQISKKKHPKLETTVGWRTTTLSLAWCKPNQVEATDVSAPPEVHKSIPRFYFKPANWLTEHF